MTRLEQRIKRSLDVIIAGTVLSAAAPALLGIGLLIKLDSPGPILFRQSRLGLRGEPFRILKFRTMRSGSDVRIDGQGRVINDARDQRHTRVGRVLRRFSIDELPQLWNVVTGDMSLVGPRPDLPIALEMYNETQRGLLRCRPGITGLSQVRGRNGLDTQEKWDLDAQYVRDASLALDARILLETMVKFLTGAGTYRRD